MVVVAWVAHTLIPSLPWAAAFALGAIVSPPDAIAATAVIRRLSVPHRIQAILESESLVNDATALVALQFAIGAMMTGTFSLSHASLRFVLVGAGGIGFGLLVGFLMRAVQRRLDDPPVQITVSLLTPFLAYLPAERLHVSGVLATVAAGMYLGWHSPVIVKARYRLQAFAFWEMIGFLLNGFIFIAIGLQLPGILRAMNGESLTHAYLRCAPDLRRRCRGSHRLGHSRRLFAAIAQQKNTHARTEAALAECCARRLGRHARRHFARCGIRIAIHVAERESLSRPQLHFVFHLLRHSRHACRARSDPAVSYSKTRDQRRRRDR